MADRNLALQLLITARDQASGVLRGLSGAVQRVGRDAARLVTGFRDVGLAIEGVRTVAGLLARVTGLSALWLLGPQELPRNNGCRAAAAAGRWAPRGAAD